MKLYFVRHGRTVWNQEGAFNGASGDSPLLPESIDTLKQLGHYPQGKFLLIRFIQVIYLERSNLLRLSKVNSRQPCPLESVSNLREWQLGKLEGLKIATLEAIYPQQIKAFSI